MYSDTIIQDCRGTTSKSWSGCASTLLREQLHFYKTEKYKLQTRVENTKKKVPNTNTKYKCKICEI